MNYEEMYDKARGELPEAVFEKERFEIPKVRGHIEGVRTIITNLYQIADAFQRPIDHILKFLLKELATPGELRRTDVVFGSKIPASLINEKIHKYANEYVLCSECGKPDTKVVEENRIHFLKCTACGAKRAIKGGY